MGSECFYGVPKILSNTSKKFKSKHFKQLFLILNNIKLTIRKVINIKDIVNADLLLEDSI